LFTLVGSLTDDTSSTGLSPANDGSICSKESEQAEIRLVPIKVIKTFILTPIDRLFTKVIALYFLIQMDRVCNYT
jgi:hypothetical protein